MKNRHFLAQIKIAFGIAVALLALTVLGLTSGWSHQWLKDVYLQTIERVTQQTAQVAAYAFITNDAEEGRRTVSTIASLPGVKSIALVRADGTELVTIGSDDTLAGDLDLPDGRDSAPVIFKNAGNTWRFSAMVATKPEPSPLESATVVPQRWGFIHVSIDKRPLMLVTLAIFAVNALIVVLASLGALFWFQRRVTRVVNPLSDLTAVMAQVDDAAMAIRAPLQGPEEVRRIAFVFNQLMERIEGHANALKAQVAIQTAEIREARDTALTAAQFKSELLSTVSHEMRTPLTSILGYVGSLQRTVDFLDVPTSEGRECTEMLARLRRSADELLSRIEQILKYAEIEAAKPETHYTDVDLAGLLHDLEILLTPIARQRGNTIRTELCGMPVVRTDIDKFSTILRNLLTNACKFTDDGVVTLSVRASASILTLSVADTGCGIPEDQIADIFAPFCSAHARDDALMGTGLGLAITKTYCERLGGSISVQSTVGRGSTFLVRLPLSAHENGFDTRNVNGDDGCEFHSQPTDHNISVPRHLIRNQKP